MLRTVASAANLRARASAVPAMPANAQAMLKRNLVSSVLLSSTRDSYEKKRIAELRDELKSRGLATNGRKDDLIRRLLDSDSARAGSNLTQAAPASRSKSTLASLRTPQNAKVSDNKATPMTEASKPTTGGEKNDAAQATADAIAEAGSPLGSLKPSETPANLEAGTVHSAAADGLASGETAKSSPDAAPEDPAISTNPPGLPPQKAPQPRETFNIQIPYYEEPAPTEAPIPLVTSYTSLKGRPQGEQEAESSSVPKVHDISARGEVSHNAAADFSSETDEAANASRSLLAEIIADLQGGNTSAAASKANKAKDKASEAASGAFGSIAAQARGVLEHATQSITQAAESSSAGSSSSSAEGSSSRSSGGRGANRPLTDEERTGAWILAGIVGGGFLLGGLGKPKKDAKDSHAQHHDQHNPKPTASDFAGTAAPVAVVAGGQQGASHDQSLADLIAAAEKALAAQSTGSTVASIDVPVVLVPVPIPTTNGSGKVTISVSGTGSGSSARRPRPEERLSQASLTQLSRLSTCEVSDALIKLKVPHGGHLPGIEVYSPHFRDGDVRICGPAFTVKMVSQDDKTAPKPSQHFVDAAEPESVMVVAAPSETRSAVWGGLMTARAKHLGVKGVVLDGRCRDLEEHRDAKFPVFARGHSTLGQSPFTRPSELQVPVTIRDPTLSPSSTFADLTVHPGDLVLADIDGVVVVPRPMVDEVIRLAYAGREVDAKCMQDLQAGSGVKETFAKHRGK